MANEACLKHLIDRKACVIINVFLCAHTNYFQQEGIFKYESKGPRHAQ